MSLGGRDLGVSRKRVNEHRSNKTNRSCSSIKRLTGLSSSVVVGRLRLSLTSRTTTFLDRSLASTFSLALVAVRRAGRLAIASEVGWIKQKIDEDEIEDPVMGMIRSAVSALSTFISVNFQTSDEARHGPSDRHIDLLRRLLENMVRVSTNRVVGYLL